jgi:hypothetical protein
MDLFKKTNVIKATACDYNASKVVILRDRSKVAKMLNRYSRRKLKQNLKTDSE